MKLTIKQRRFLAFYILWVFINLVKWGSDLPLQDESDAAEFYFPTHIEIHDWNKFPGFYLYADLPKYSYDITEFMVYAIGPLVIIGFFYLFRRKSPTLKTT